MPAPVFPIHILPEVVQEIISANYHQLGYPSNYQCAAILSAVSAATGKRFSHYYRYKNYPQIWMGLVGNPGQNKSAPLKWFLRPLSDRDRDAYKTAKSEAEKGEEGDFNYPQIIAKDATMEKLQIILENNQYGMLYYTDELKSWISHMARYSSGDSKQSEWNSISENDDVTVNRVNRPDIRITEPFVSVAGTIQPAVLREIFKNKTDDGFVHRITWVYSEAQKIVRPSMSPDPEIPNEWGAIIGKILAYNPVQGPTIGFTPEAKTLYDEWQEKVYTRVDEANAEGEEMHAGYISKSPKTVLRVACILHSLNCACEGVSPEMDIPATTLQNSIDLFDGFFSECYELFRDQICEAEYKPTAKEALILALTKKDSFTKAEIIEARDKQADELGKKVVSDRTIDRAFGNTKLLKHVGNGVYEKNLIKD